jgi:peptidoglycan hydrolase-like protein with peptidoglycan-binding domain
MRQLLTTAIALTFAAGMAVTAQAQGVGHPAAATSPNYYGHAYNEGGMHYMSRAMIRRAQWRLRQQGLYRGRIDGVMGPATSAALRSYQRENGLRQTANLDPMTRDRLLGNRTAGYGASGAASPNMPEGTYSRGDSSPSPRLGPTPNGGMAPPAGAGVPSGNALPGASGGAGMGSGR